MCGMSQLKVALTKHERTDRVQTPKRQAVSANALHVFDAHLSRDTPCLLAKDADVETRTSFLRLKGRVRNHG
jgi:hypothetical protein